MAAWKLNTDGGSRGNPGKAAWAFVLQSPTGEIFEKGGLMGISTNNCAEYEGMIQGLAFALAQKADHLEVFSDSELIVKQLRGEYKVKHADMIPLWEEAKKLLRDFTGHVTLNHVRRELNKEADKLCNLVLDGKWVGARPEPEAPKTPGTKPTPKPLTITDEATLASIRAVFARYGAAISEEQASEAGLMLRKILA
jgi:ribonuclease HI